MIDALDQCKVIALGSVGADRVDVAAATAKGIPVTNVPDIFIDEVADHTMMLVLATYRRLIIVDSMARDGRWGEGRPLLYGYPRLMGLTLGLISFGNVAKAVAARAQPFGMHMVAFDPYIGELAMTRERVEPVGLTELLQRSDILSMHAPYTSETHHMLGEEQFRLMKPHSILINTGRGDTVDEAALVRALQEGWIGGAGLDVLEKEPPRARESVAQDGQGGPDASRGIGLVPHGPGAAEARWPRDSTRSLGSLAKGLREPVGAREDRTATLASVPHGVRCSPSSGRSSIQRRNSRDESSNGVVART